MKRLSLSAAACSCALILAGQSLAAPMPVDLSTWTQDGNGNWVLAGDNNSVLQTLNSPPTVLHNGINSQGTELSGSITVETTGDDDFIGFVLGYTQGDIDGNPDTDFILVDWKQGDQSGWDEGMSISRVTGPIQTGGASTGSDLWQHTGPVSFIERAATLGDVGWDDNTTYNFEIEFTSTNIRVLVDGVEQFDISGTFSDGSFGFFNFSQPNVRYAGITSAVLPDPDPVPLPAGAFLFAPAIGGIILRLRNKKA